MHRRERYIARLDEVTITRKGDKKGPIATVKFGSASVPIYLSESNGRKRYFIARYREGKRIRKAFLDLAAAKKEAMFVAQRIQSGMQHVTDLKPHERDNYKKAVELLDVVYACACHAASCPLP